MSKLADVVKPVSQFSYKFWPA